MKYSTTEENLNIATHGLGAVLSIPACWWLVIRAESWQALTSVIVFGASLFVLYMASTLYHAARNEARRARLRIFDHAAIFLLIAGTYTPICVVSLWHTWGMHLLIVIWSLASIGVVLKLFLTGRFDRASTLLYVAMGWVAIAAIRPLLEALSTGALLWLLAGGISYTLGAILYSIRRLPLNHAIFHVFVLLGSFCHYMMIYKYIL